LLALGPATLRGLDHDILQESVKVQAGLVMLPGELDGLLGASAQAGSYGK
jgi:hypothetical protein